jgi:biotin synthase
MDPSVRHDWSVEEVSALYQQPILELVYQAASVHRTWHQGSEVQVCSLISVKTGNCPEDCAYCPQAARYQTEIDKHGLLPVDQVLAFAKNAKANGATRVCMGAAWRKVRNNQEFEQVLDMVKAVKETGIEVCATLGMMELDQAQKLKSAGLHAYNHNLDTSEDHYGEVISTRTYQDRLKTLANVREAGLTVCCGGIIGLGEGETDRIALLHTLATMDPHPESVPVNALVPVPGTPLAQQERVQIWEMLRMIATARILMPRAMVRLSAGRLEMSEIEQAMCFLAGANSLFAGDKLLTTPNPAKDADAQLFDLLQLKKRSPYQTVPHELQHQAH